MRHPGLAACKAEGVIPEREYSPPMEPPKLTIDQSFRRGLAAFNNDRLQWLDEAAALGPLVGLGFGKITAWVLTGVELARLITESAAFVRPLNFRRPTSMAIGKSLFIESQKEWEAIGPHC